MIWGSLGSHFWSEKLKNEATSDLNSENLMGLLLIDVLLLSVSYLLLVYTSHLCAVRSYENLSRSNPSLNAHLNMCAVHCLQCSTFLVYIINFVIMNHPYFKYHIDSPSWPCKFYSDSRFKISWVFHQNVKKWKMWSSRKVSSLGWNSALCCQALKAQWQKCKIYNHVKCLTVTIQVHSVHYSTWNKLMGRFLEMDIFPRSKQLIENTEWDGHSLLWM